MASDYGLNFGFRRSDESSRVSAGRYKTPAGAAGVMQLGTCVEIDPANEGRLRQAALNAAARTGICGMLVQEEIMFRSVYENELVDSFQIGLSKADRPSVITNGAGTKVWFKNTPQITRADGRVIPAVTVVADIGTLSVGDLLGWDGTAWAVTNGTTLTNAHFEVTEVKADQLFVEAVCLA